MQQTRTHSIVFTGACALLVSLASLGDARAESPPQTACKDKAVGDACVMDPGGAGTCATGKCNELDYSQGSPPKAVEVDCLVCESGAGPGTPPDGVGTSTPPAGESGAVDGKSTPPENESRCAITSTGGGAGDFAGLLLALGLAARRHRRRRPAPARSPISGD